MTKIKDSGKRSNFSTGAHRDDASGKGRMDLLPFMAMMELSKVFEEGANKYRANNWRRGIPLSRYVDSGTRHLAKWMAGWRDEPHLVQAAWNFMCLIETQEMIKQGVLPEELNDLPYNPLEILDNPNDIPELELGDEGEELDRVGREAEIQKRKDKYREDVRAIKPGDNYIVGHDDMGIECVLQHWPADEESRPGGRAGCKRVETFGEGECQECDCDEDKPVKISRSFLYRDNDGNLCKRGGGAVNTQKEIIETVEDITFLDELEVEDENQSEYPSQMYFTAEQWEQWRLQGYDDNTIDFACQMAALHDRTVDEVLENTWEFVVKREPEPLIDIRNEQQVTDEMINRNTEMWLRDNGAKGIAKNMLDGYRPEEGLESK